VFAEWPTPLVTSPFEVGLKITYPWSSIENDFSWCDYHPVVEGFKAYLRQPEDRPTWDLTALLYAVEGDKWFNLSPAGKLEITDEGSSIFHEEENENTRYLSVTDEQAQAVKNHLVEMCTTPPKKYAK